MEKLINKTPDRELVTRYLLGDEKALEILIHRHKERLFTAIIVFTKDRYIAEDLFQELWIKVIEKLKAGKYNERGTFFAWVSRISYRLCIDNYRKQKRAVKNLETTHDFDLVNRLPSSGETAEEILFKKGEEQKIKSLLDRLPPEQQEVVMLRHYYDLSFKEIQEMTGHNMNTLVGRMRYALINLRKMIISKNIELN